MALKRKYLTLKITGIFLLLVSVAGFFIYTNLNRLLSNALHNSFSNSSMSDVYELKFENLSVNIFDRNIKVYNVVMQPLAKPLNSYPYINSSFKLTTKELALENVNITELLRSGKLKLERILIDQPEIESSINGDVPIFFPFNDTTIQVNKAEKKKSILSFSLQEFKLINASIHAINSAAMREFNMRKLTISLDDLLIDQQKGMDVLSYKNVDLTIESLDGKMKKEAVKYVSVKKFKIKIDSLYIQKTIDTLMFNFRDFNTNLGALDIQTADSIFHIALQDFEVSYKNKSIQINNILFKPNISDAAMQRKFVYQNTQFSGTVGSLRISNIEFDTLIYKRKLLIDVIALDKVKAAIFKDKTKPLDKNRFPEYLAQQIKSIPIPLLIKQVAVTNASLLNTEKKVDSAYAKVNLNRVSVIVKNITTLPTIQKLVLKGTAYLENKVPFNLALGFDYQRTEFSIDVKFKKFNMPDLNPVVKAYTPATIYAGTCDGVTISGNAYKTYSTGKMKFLYHDLNIDLALKKRSQWLNNTLSFLANSVAANANPAAADLPPREVTFHVDRDMNKGFINIVIKSALNGLKETMIMNKENKKAYKSAKKKMKKEQSK
jgi:hypothetical protein